MIRPHHIPGSVNIFFAALLSFLPVTGTGQGDDDDDDDNRKPTATIFGGGEVCHGDSVPAFIYFTGFGPWSAQINDNNGEYARLTRVESPYTLWLKPDEDDIYYIEWVRDRIGREGKTYGADTVIVKERSPAEIKLERSVYRVDELGVTLVADPSGGIFAGKGVSSGRFYPNIAGTEGSPHLVTYSYTAPNQCISRDSVWIDVIHGVGNVYLVHEGDTVNEICNNEKEYILAGYNQDGIPGRFELRVQGTTEVIPGHINDEDPGDDRAAFDPGELDGVYDIAYIYTFRELTVTSLRQVAISSLASLEITGIPGVICKNGTRFRLEAELDSYDPGAVYTFSGNGITGNQQSGFFFSPADTSVRAGKNIVTLDYRSSLGCREIIDREIEVGSVPGTDFTIGSVCIPVEGGTVSFINTTTGKDEVETWSWFFGDVNSGADNYSTLEEPEHFYDGAGTRTVTLSATTGIGCTSEHTAEILLLNDPEAEFTWISDCYVEGEATELISTSSTSHGTIDSLVWIFTDPTGEEIGRIPKGPGDDAVQYVFPSVSDYGVRLEAYNSGGCSGETTRELELFPTVKIPAGGFLEDFNGVGLQWTPRSEGENHSWVWGTPDFEGFETEEGDLAWYTELPYNEAGYLENSWVQSYCLDLGAGRRPFIELDLMKSFIPNISGAVLQYQDLPAEGWKTVGRIGDGIGWYNTATISTSPGGSSYGWGLNSFVPDREWVKARHDLNMITGDRPFKLRFVLGTIGGQLIGNEGFAFDNVQILERSRFSVLEHFTNTGEMSAMHADEVVDEFDTDNRDVVISLQYHTDFPGTDPMNLNNPDPASTRSGVLGVGQVPYALLNGGVSHAGRYDFTSPSRRPNGQELFRASLEVPPFSVDLEAGWMTNHVEITTMVTCSVDSFSSNIQLYIALIETEVLSYTGGNSDNHFRNVVLDMVPTPAGKLLGGTWYSGQEVTSFFTWDYASFIEDVDDLAVVAFIQDRSTGEILQAAVSYKDPTVGTNRTPLPPYSLRIFPNPSRGPVALVTSGPFPEEGRLKVFDLSGKTVFMEEVDPGQEVVRTDLGQLDPGIYIIQLHDRSGLRGYAKLSLTR